MFRNNNEALDALKNKDINDVIKQIPSEFFKDRHFILEAIKIYPPVFDYIKDINDVKFITRLAALSPNVSDYIENKIKEMINYIKENSVDLFECGFYGYVDEHSSEEDIQKYIKDFLNAVVDDGINHYRGNILLETDYFYRCMEVLLREFFKDKDYLKIRDRDLVWDFLYRSHLSPLEFSIDKIRNDEETIIYAINITEGRAISSLNKEYQEDKEYVTGWLQFFSRAYFFLSEELRNDFSLLKLAVLGSPDAVIMANEQTRASKNNILELVKASPYVLLYLEKKYHEDIEIICCAIEENPYVYNELEDSLKDNEQIKAYYKERIEKCPFANRELIDPPPRPYFKKALKKN